MDSNGHISNLREFEKTLKDGLSELVEIHRDTNAELKALRDGLLQSATGKDHVPLSVVKWLLGSMALINVLMVIWFTGIAPRIGADGVTFQNRQQASR
jgi:hypothetical protein